MVHEEAKTRIRPIFSVLVALICLSSPGLRAASSAWGELGPDEIASVANSGKALGFVPERMANGFKFDALFADYFVKGLPDIAG